MEGYKYVANDKGIMLPKISEDTADNHGLVQRCTQLLLNEV